MAAATLTFALRVQTFMEMVHRLYQSLGFRRTPERDWYVPGEDIPLWVFTLQLVEARALPAAR